MPCNSSTYELLLASRKKLTFRFKYLCLGHAVRAVMQRFHPKELSRDKIFPGEKATKISETPGSLAPELCAQPCSASDAFSF